MRKTEVASMHKMIRWHKEAFVHFVTNRTEHEMFFLNPAKKVNDLILFRLAKAKEKRGKHIRLFAFVFMSNHLHFLLQDPKGELAQFMGYFQGNLAKALNKHHGRRGRFRSREYSDVIVDGEAEFLDQYQYIAANPVAAGLVASPGEWAGVSSVSYMLGGQPVTGIGTNVTQYGNACRHGQKANERDFEERFSFELSVLPMLSDKTALEQIDYLEQTIADAASSALKERKTLPVMGMEKVLKQSPFDRPKSPARSPRFKFMSFCKARAKELKTAYKYFVGVYRGCCQMLIAYFEKELSLGYHGAKICDHAIARYISRAPAIVWPAGCYVPTTHQPITE